MRAVLLAALLVCLPSCSRGEEEAPVPENTPRSDPWVDAMQVWKQGENYIVSDFPIDRKGDIFSGIDGAACDFLDRAELKPAAPSLCTMVLSPYEEKLEAELKEDSGVFQLQALVLLMRAYAPASVDLQWNALQQLKDLPERPGLRALLDELEERFSESVIAAALEHSVPEDFYKQDPFLSWNIRAAGVIRLRRALPTLVKLSLSNHLDTSLAAERSLEDFVGPEGDEALAQCLLGSKRDAFIRAGFALLERNKSLLVRTLRRTVPAEPCRRWQGILLARADEHSAVPILCETIPKSSAYFVSEMFEHLDRLAREQDVPLVRQLLHNVRPDQEEQARRLEEDLVRRFAGR